MNLKLALHIPFFINIYNIEYNNKRINFINTIIKNVNEYQIKTDLYLHCNVNVTLNYFEPYINGKITIICHDITNEQTPMVLTRKPRSLMLQQINEYDYFAYIEDDISFTKEALNYWLQYKDECIKENYNLGFCRYEVKNDEIFLTDIIEKFKKTIIINDTTYVINKINPYCACWIYDKQEFNKFIKHETFNNLELMSNYGYPEKAAIGFTTLGGYKDTIIPLINNKLNPDCKIHHLPNNYINHPTFCKIKFDDAIELI